jgi:hypothetical protein
MQQLKELEQFNQVYKKHKEKQKVTHDELKTGNKLSLFKNKKNHHLLLSVSKILKTPGTYANLQ